MLVCLDLNDPDYEESAAECVRLANSAGALRIKMVGGRRSRPDPKLFAGSGKVAEVGREADALNAATVIFNHALRHRAQCGDVSPPVKLRR